jgi:hypothetical protein
MSASECFHDANLKRCSRWLNDPTQEKVLIYVNAISCSGSKIFLTKYSTFALKAGPEIYCYAYEKDIGFYNSPKSRKFSKFRK